MTKPPETHIAPSAAAAKHGGHRLLSPARYLLYRLATYWLPVAPGWLSWRVLQRREYV